MSMFSRGLLSKYFDGVGVKRLSAVETSPDRSNQHEFNGSRPLRKLLGDDDRRNIRARFIWLADEQEGITDDSTVSWYDSRRNHPSRTEYRLYYPSNAVADKHLLTLEPGISENQTDAMRGKRLQLVLPASLHETYRDTQKTWLMKVADFVALVQERQG